MIASTVRSLFVFVAVLAPAARADFVKSIRNFVPRDQIKAILDTVQQEKKGSKILQLRSSLVERIQKTSGVKTESCAEEQQEEGTFVPLKTMTDTTNVHRDRFVMRHGAPVVHDQVTFLVLESNPTARFVHGQEELPLEEGSLMTFSGDVEHHTIVPIGHVKIAGPFHASSMERVGRPGGDRVDLCYIGSPDECEGPGFGDYYDEPPDYCVACTGENERCIDGYQWLGCMTMEGRCYQEADCYDNPWPWSYTVMTKEECISSNQGKSWREVGIYGDDNQEYDELECFHLKDEMCPYLNCEEGSKCCELPYFDGFDYCIPLTGRCFTTPDCNGRPDAWDDGEYDFDDSDDYEVMSKEDCTTSEDGKSWRGVAAGMCSTECIPCNSPNGVCGDPHFKTWSGKKFDYHGACDLVLVQNDNFYHGMDLRIHIRTERQGFFSSTSAVAVKIGDEVLEITMDGFFYINGSKNSAETLDTTLGRVDLGAISGFPLQYDKVEKRGHHYYYIVIDSGEEIVIKKSVHFMAATVKGPSKKHFGGSVGLMGSFKDGSMIARDGATTIADANIFGQEWQVLETEPLLFRDARAPQHPQKCIPADLVSKKRRLAQSKVSHEVAKDACGHVMGDDFESCVFDVMATGDVDVAHASFW